jgi:tetratricopeptide (TPR) repeat protein
LLGVAAPPDLDRLRTEIESARAFYWQGRPGRAHRRYARILAVLEANEQRGNPAVVEVRTRASVGLAMTEFELRGDLPSALGHLDAAEQLVHAAGLDGLRVTVLGQRALLLLRVGDVDEAMEAFDRALESAGAALPEDQMLTLVNRGALLLERGALKDAAADLARAVDLAAAVGDDQVYWAARHNLAYVDFLQGRLPKALAGMEEVLSHDQDPHPVNLLDKARVLREAGLVRDADATLERAASMLRMARLHQDLAETELVRAECALVEGEPRRARALAASAHRRLTRRRNLLWQRKAELMVLRCERSVADEQSERSRRNALLGLSRRAADLAAHCRTESRDDLARAAELLGAECRLRAGGEPPEVTPAVLPGDALQIRLQVREVRALTHLRSGDRGAAAREVRRGLEELGSYQHRFGSLDLRTASAVHGVALARLGLDVALRSGSPAEVFAFVERSRAVSTRLSQVRPPSDERTGELLAMLRQVEEDARGLSGDPAAADTLARLRGRGAQLQREIRARAWEVESDHRSPVEAAARLGPVRAAAGDRAFATFARHRGRWVAVVAAGRRAELRDLAAVAEVDELVRRVRADLDALAMPRLPEPLLRAVRASVTTTLARLDDLLVRPLRIGDRSLVVSCSGSLAVLPWSLLPSRFGLPVVVTPSATGWLRSQAPRESDPSVVSVSGPDLHGSELEAQRVADAWAHARVVTGDLATVATVKAALERADVVHVAAHGTHRQDSPLFSSLRLADGQLYAHELDAESHIASFVALSACEAGLSTVRPGDEGLGLTNVLLQLGTRAVLAGVARVRDDVAAEVMRKVHHGLASGVDSAGALAVAQADCVDAGAPVPFLSFGSSW